MKGFGKIGRAAMSGNRYGSRELQGDEGLTADPGWVRELVRTFAAQPLRSMAKPSALAIFDSGCWGSQFPNGCAWWPTTLP